MSPSSAAGTGFGMERPVIHDLQVLRGVAILFVLLQHYQAQLPAPQALRELVAAGALWRGVDLFFALSGFLVTRSLLAGTGGASCRIRGRDFARFWIRRGLRIMPAAWVWAILILAFGLSGRTDAGFGWGALALSGLAAVTATANLYLVHCAEWVQTSSPLCAHPYLGSFYWSLSLEEQFYLLLSLSFLMARPKYGVMAVGLMGLASASLDKPMFGLAWAFRMEALSLGAACALLFAQAHCRPPRRSVRLAGLCVAILAIALYAPGGPRALTVCAFAAAAAVWLAAYDGACGAGWPSRLLGLIGTRSYAIYLCHMPLLLLCSMALEWGWMPRGWLWPALAACVAIGVCSELTHRLVEVPFTRLGRRLGARGGP